MGRLPEIINYSHTWQCTRLGGKKSFNWLSTKLMYDTRLFYSGESCTYVVYHSHNDINHNSHTIHIEIQMQADSVVSDTNGFINFWLQFMATQGERHNSYYADPDPHAQRILWCLRSQFISAGQDLKNLTTTATIENSTLYLNGPISTACFSKSSNSQDHPFRAWHHLHSSPISCLGVYYDNGDCHILCALA